MLEMSQRKLQRIWLRFKKSNSQQLRDVLIEHYLPLVRSLAERLGAKLPGAVEVDDLVGTGVFGLIDAIDCFDPGRNIKFETYAATRIRGAMIDELRVLDWVPRIVRLRARKLTQAIEQHHIETGNDPTDDEIAQRLQLAPAAFERLLRDGRPAGLYSLSHRPGHDGDDPTDAEICRLIDTRASDPVREAQRNAVKELLGRGLSRAQRMIVLLYYYENLTMREIGKTLDLSESRVSQLHTTLLEQLRSQICENELEPALKSA